MREIETTWKRGAVLVCTHERPAGADKPSCGDARGGALKDWLKDRIRAEGLKGEIIAVKTSCQGVCSALGVTTTVLSADGAAKRTVLVASEAERPELWDFAKNVLGAKEV